MAGITEVTNSLWAFYNEFLPSFPRDQVPARQKFPYLTYDVTVPTVLVSDQNSSTSNDVLQSVLIYDKAENYSRLYADADRIGAALPPSGVSIPFEDGKQSIMLFRGTPFMQNYTLTKEEKEQKIKAVLLNVELRAHFI